MVHFQTVLNTTLTTVKKPLICWPRQSRPSRHPATSTSSTRCLVTAGWDKTHCQCLWVYQSLSFCCNKSSMTFSILPWCLAMAVAFMTLLQNPISHRYCDSSGDGAQDRGRHRLFLFTACDEQKLFFWLPSSVGMGSRYKNKKKYFEIYEQQINKDPFIIKDTKTTLSFYCFLHSRFLYWRGDMLYLTHLSFILLSIAF